jgi:8-amino-7-oxononanoate synthase
MADFPEKLRRKLDQRKAEGIFRTLYPSNGLVDFSSNDYLGFARSSGDGTGYAAGSTGSRLISGNHPLHIQAEETIRKFHRAEAALLFNSGYDANVGLLPALLQREDYIFYDVSIHASIRDGIALGKAKAYRYAHNSLESLKARTDQVLGGTKPVNSEVYVITETVFSMEGDGPDLKELAMYCREQGFRLIVDEAHAAGVLGPQGRGVVVGAGCVDLIFARIITFGKALGCHGAAVLGSTLLREYLINYSRSFIYTTALPPASVQAILEAYGKLEGEAGNLALEYLARNIDQFKKMLQDLGLSGYFIPARAAIQCCEIGGYTQVKAVSGELRTHGYDVKPILSPTVPKGRECLRFSLHAFNTPEEITGVLTILEKSLRKRNV